MAGVEGGPSGGGAPGAGLGSAGGPSIAVGAEGGLRGPTSVPISPGGFRGFGEFGDLGQFRSLGPAALGPEATMLSFPVINESPVGRSFLENTAPLQIGEATEINFDNHPAAAEELSVQAAVAEAEAIFAAARNKLSLEERPVILPSLTWQAQRLVEPVAIPRPWIEPTLVPGRLLNEHTFIRSYISTLLNPGVQDEPDMQAGTGLKTESKVLTSAVPVVSEQSVIVEQEIEETSQELARQDQQTQETEEEEFEKIKKKYVIDERALSTVIKEFKEAVAKAKELAGKLKIKLTGKLISRFLPGQHQGNESEAVKGKGVDGSIIERKQSIEEAGVFSSLEEALGRVINEAYAKPPIKLREEGKDVGEEDVWRVYKPYMVKPKRVTEEIIKIVKKRRLVTQPGGTAVDAPVQTQVAESRIEDYPALAEVFQKAA